MVGLVSSLWKPDLESVSDPDSLLNLLRGLYSSLQPSGALMAVPTRQTVSDKHTLLVCLTKFYGAAFVMTAGARNLPRPSSTTVSTPELLLPWLVRLYGLVTA